MARRELLIATRNKGKAAELRAVLAGVGLSLVTLDETNLNLEVAETGSTYRENALLKARQYAEASGLVTLADDSGLEVDALGGLPGINSARHGGPGLTSEQRYQLLLDQLRGVSMEARTARFRCVVVLCGPSGLLETTEGVCEGLISTEPAGSKGFGYDPVFYLPKWQLTMAQLPADVKNRISHRGQAVAAMLPYLQELSVSQNWQFWLRNAALR